MEATRDNPKDFEPPLRNDYEYWNEVKKEIQSL